MVEITLAEVPKNETEDTKKEAEETKEIQNNEAVHHTLVCCCCVCCRESLRSTGAEYIDMKYLEVPPLSSICSKINQNTDCGVRLNCRIEVYSCSSEMDIREE